MRDAIPDIEGRIASAVEIEVEQVQPLAVEQRVVGIEVAVDAAGVSRRVRDTEAIAGREQPPEPQGPRRSAFGKRLQTPMENAQLVGHRVPAQRRNSRLVQLVRGLGEASRQRHSARLRQQCSRRRASHLALQPHPELRD